MKRNDNQRTILDPWLLLSAVMLALFGLVMVASTSIAVSEKLLGNTYYFLLRQSLFLGIGFCLGWFTYHVPIRYWQRIDRVALIASMLMLVMVLIPGIGREVNGSMRWIKISWLHLQVSEFAKLAVITFVAGYLVRHQESLTSFTRGFVNPMLVVSLISILLLREPDFGAVVVLVLTSLGMLFMGGIRLRHFFFVVALMAVALMVIAVASPYRWGRLTAFLDPWADQFNSGYQLTQALIAIGRGEWFGVGLGASVQKLFYLPEAHTDFMFAVIGEELGFVGLSVVILLFMVLFIRGMATGYRACERKDYFAGYLAYGLSMWIGLEALISMGVNIGLLPTKGLTLPFMSYGGSSLLAVAIGMGMLLRIASDHDSTPAKTQYQQREYA